jgi:hypothetical protein
MIYDSFRLLFVTILSQFVLLLYAGCDTMYISGRVAHPPFPIIFTIL